MIYGLVLIFCTGFKIGNPFNEYSWLQVFLWPLVLIYMLYESLALLWRCKIHPLVELAMFAWFKKNLSVDSFAVNVIYNKCLRREISFPKWRGRIIEKLAEQNGIQLNAKINKNK